MERESFAVTVSYALPPEHSLAPLFRGYTGLGARADAVAEIDHQIGILIKKISHLGVRPRTLVVITGYAPDFFDRAHGAAPVQVPLMAALEGHSREGAVVHHAVHLIDLVPTFLELAAITPPPTPGPHQLDGKSFWPLMVSGSQFGSGQL